jgi:hypothetical protein
MASVEALLLMVVAGGFLGLNLQISDHRFGGSSGEFEIYGWPLTFERYIHYQEAGNVISKDWMNDDGALMKPIGVNILVALLLSFSTAWVFEYLVRRREGRRP